ncbi:hypothetical protein ACGFIV_25240, partial [Sphaerisporangium sp. NPDC049003]|uniref:hypothetical protein n=1 Tax=Sphaerisporangium sp. NPDC049003 TaxID=3364517 RepID=UPI00370F9CD4
LACSHERMSPYPPSTQSFIPVCYLCLFWQGGLLLVWDGAELLADDAGELTVALGSPGTRRVEASIVG